LVRELAPFQKVTAPAAPVPVTELPDEQVTTLLLESKQRAEPDPVPKLRSLKEEDSEVVPPIPTLPVTFKTPFIPVLERSETPVTLRLDRLAAELTDKEPPTPTLPVVLRLVALTAAAFKFPSWDRPETFNPPKVPIEVTDREAPIPALPVTDREEPTPRNPEKKPFPIVLKL
jgi:hypothetical protein